MMRRQRARALLGNDRGATAIELMVVTAAVALAGVGAFRLFEDRLGEELTDIGVQVAGILPGQSTSGPSLVGGDEGPAIAGTGHALTGGDGSGPVVDLDAMEREAIHNRNLWTAAAGGQGGVPDTGQLLGDHPLTPEDLHPGSVTDTPAEISYSFAEDAIREGDFDTAAFHLAEAAEYEHDARLLLDQAMVEAARGDHERAESLLNEYHVEHAFERAREQILEGDFAGAAAALETLTTEQYPDLETNLLYIATEAKNARLDDYDRYMAAYEEAGGTEEPQLFAVEATGADREQHRRASAAYEAGDYEEALEALSQIERPTLGVMYDQAATAVQAATYWNERAKEYAAPKADSAESE